MNELALLDIFSGIGGFSLAAEQCAIRTIGFSEIEPYPCRVLAERFPGIPNLGDVRNITRDSVIERTGCLPTIIAGGFPCQPHSLAGKRGASGDARDLWSECERLLGELRPRYALFENVPGITSSEGGRFLNRVICGLARLRFACMRIPVSAADIGAPHHRNRMWFLCVDQVAYSQGGDGRLQLQPGRSLETGGESQRSGEANGVGQADANHAGRREQWFAEPASPQQSAAERSGLKWPARDGLWPARPGQPQHEWEPRRTVGDTARGQGDGRNSGSVDETERGGRRGDDAVDAASEAMADRSDHERERDRGARNRSTESANGGERKAQPELGRNASRTSDKLDADETRNRCARLKSIGNSIVPQAAEVFFRAIFKHHNK